MDRLRRGYQGVLGAILGDALGCPHEFKSAVAIPPNIQLVMPTSYPKTYPHIAYGIWTDDSSQLLCLLESLADANGQLALDDFAAKLLAWRHHGRHQSGGIVFDCGLTTDAALQRFRSGVPASQAGDTNGAATAMVRLCVASPQHLLRSAGRTLCQIRSHLLCSNHG